MAYMRFRNRKTIPTHTDPEGMYFVEHSEELVATYLVVRGRVLLLSSGEGGGGGEPDIQLITSVSSAPSSDTSVYTSLKIDKMLEDILDDLGDNDTELRGLILGLQEGKADLTALTTHTDNTDIHVTSLEKESWNDKWDYDEETIKNVKVNEAGNADTVNGKTVGVNVPADAKFTDTVYTHPTTAGNKHIPTGGASGQYLKYSESGTAAWATPAKADVGLGNVDNTSDADKPVSTAQQTALNAKIDASKFQVVPSLPSNPDPDTFYFVLEEE